MAISPRSGAHGSERNLLLSAIRRPTADGRRPTELARLSRKIILPRHHMRTANGAAKTMSGWTSTFITFLHLDELEGCAYLRLTVNSLQDAELEHIPWSRVHPRSFGCVQMGFRKPTYVMFMGSSYNRFE